MVIKFIDKEKVALISVGKHEEVYEKMIPSQPGTGISLCKVTNVEPLGFWMLVDDREYFVPFTDYPVFQRGSIQQIFQMRRVSPTQLHWPDLDADIEIDALEQPEHYPLVFR